LSTDCSERSLKPLRRPNPAAADFDGGSLEFGTGPVSIDEYVAPMCPFCAQFAQTNGELLLAGVESGVITLRVHALTFLDSNSQGTNYSSRASAALTCQATLNPDQTLDFISELFANQRPQHVRFVYDGDSSADPGAPAGPPGSAQIHQGDQRTG